MEEEGEGGGRWAGRPWTRTWPARRREEEALDPAAPEVEQAGLALSRLGGALEGKGTGAGSGGWLVGGMERRRGECNSPGVCTVIVYVCYASCA